MIYCIWTLRLHILGCLALISFLINDLETAASHPLNTNTHIKKEKNGKKGRTELLQEALHVT
jgi:hypothetical protein